MLDHLLEVYRGRRVPSLISPVIIGRNIMNHCYVWLDTEANKVRELKWTFFNRFSMLLLFLITVAFVLGLSDSLASISDFGRWLNMTTTGVAACLKVLFVISYRSQITEFIECVEKLDRTMRQKAESDFVIRKWRRLYFLFETLLVYVALFFTFPNTIAYSLPGLLAEVNYLPIPAVIPWGIHESQLGFGLCFIFYLWGSNWGAVLYISSEFLLGNIINQFILNLEIVTHEIEQLERVAEDSEMVPIDKERKLIAILQDYHYLSASIQNFNRTSQPILFLVVGTNMLLQTFISIEVAIMLNVDLSQTLRALIFFFWSTLTFFYWCWLGQRLTDVSAKISFAIYEIGWDCGDLRFKKLQFMAMQMTSQPLRLEAIPFFVLDHELFKSVLRRAYSIMAVAKDL